MDARSHFPVSRSLIFQRNNYSQGSYHGNVGNDWEVVYAKGSRMVTWSPIEFSWGADVSPNLNFPSTKHKKNRLYLYVIDLSMEVLEQVQSRLCSIIKKGALWASVWSSVVLIENTLNLCYWHPDGVYVSHLRLEDLEPASKRTYGIPSIILFHRINITQKSNA